MPLATVSTKTPRLLVCSLFAVACVATGPSCGDGTGGTVPTDVQESEPVDTASDAPDGGGTDGGPDTPDSIGDPGRDAGTPEATLARLDGDPAAVAIETLSDFGPVPTTDEALGDDGLLLDRLIAGVAPDATVDDLNAALGRHGAGISMLRADREWLELSIPMQPDLDAIEALADAIMEDRAFAWAEPAFASLTPPAATADAPGEKAALSADTLSQNPYLQTQRFVAAWNLAAVAARGAVPRVLVLDKFAVVDDGPPQLAALRFLPTDSATRAGGPSEFVGNHGLWVAGVIAADPDERPPTGTSHEPGRLMQLTGLQAAHVSDLALLEVLRANIPATGNVVVNMSLGAPRGRGVDGPAALAWRKMLRDAGDRVIVMCTAGNRGQERPTPDARLNSDCTAQASFDDLAAAVQPSRRGSFRVLWDRETRLDPTLRTRAGAVFVVGSSNEAGTRSAFSTPGESIRMIGEKILGPCVLDDTVCTGGFYLSDGTSAASPQLAGLAAYIWALEPSLTASELHELLRAHYDGRWVDAFAASMHIPAYRSTFPALAALADVDADGSFGVGDIAAVLSAIEARHTEQPNSALAAPDYGRTDLNGDGYTRRDTAARFDFAPVRPPSYGSHRYRFTPDGADVDLDETAVTDLEILCALAYSPVFPTAAAAVDERDRLLRHECGSTDATLIVDGSPSSTAETGGPAFDVCVRARRNDRDLVGLRVDFTLEGTGAVAPASATSDATGRACTRFTPPSRASTTPAVVTARASIGGRLMQASHAVSTTGELAWAGVITFSASSSQTSTPACTGGSTQTVSAEGTIELNCGAWDPATQTANCRPLGIEGSITGSRSEVTRMLSSADTVSGPGGDPLFCEALDDCTDEARFCERIIRTDDVCCGHSAADCERLMRDACLTCKVDGSVSGGGGGGGPLTAANMVDGGVSLRLSPVDTDGLVDVSLGGVAGCLRVNVPYSQTVTWSLSGDCSDETRAAHESSVTDSSLDLTVCLSNMSTRTVAGVLTGDVLTAEFVGETSGSSSTRSRLSVTIRPAE